MYILKHVNQVYICFVVGGGVATNYHKFSGSK